MCRQQKAKEREDTRTEIPALAGWLVAPIPKDSSSRRFNERSQPHEQTGEVARGGMQPTQPGT